MLSSFSVSVTFSKGSKAVPKSLLWKVRQSEGLFNYIYKKQGDLFSDVFDIKFLWTLVQWHAESYEITLQCLMAVMRKLHITYARLEPVIESRAPAWETFEFALCGLQVALMVIIILLSSAVRPSHQADEAVARGRLAASRSCIKTSGFSRSHLFCGTLVTSSTYSYRSTTSFSFSSFSGSHSSNSGTCSCC